ncbi:MAG: hypothetical protein Q4C52_10570 [Eubacteriales bacterium]|nr:hypothetical protein [Eubacteriales bacterium]
MKKQEVMVYGGDVLKEIEEFEKLIADKDQTIVYITQTAGCQTWFTIYCC